VCCIVCETDFFLFKLCLNSHDKVKVKVKGKSEHLYGIQTTLKRSGMDHTVLPAINTIPAFYLVSVHQMAPPLIEVANI